MAGKRVIGLIRVSTKMQAEEGASLEAQAEQIRAYCGLYGLELVRVVEDPGYSGTTLHRPGTQEALAALQDGQADGLIVTKIDRLTRSLRDWQMLIKEYFGEGQHQLYSVGDHIDTTTATGRLVLNMLLTVSQWEVERTTERIQESLNYKKRKGERTGGVPFGMDVDSEGKLVPNQAEQEAISKMRDLRLRGYSFAKVANYLNSQKIPTKGRVAASGLTARGQGTWRETQVIRILGRKVEEVA